MATVQNLIPGDVVLNPIGDKATFIARTEHPLFAGLQLVVWRMKDGSWSHDALSERQDVGEVERSTPDQRRDALSAALLGAEQR